MIGEEQKRDKHFPTFFLDNFIRKVFDKPDKLDADVAPGEVVADLGCGPGYFTFAIADKVGTGGRVYAVDSDEHAVKAVAKKAAKRHYQNVDPHTASAGRLDFIEDASVDFVLADGLLCCVAPREHRAAVSEIKRILKPNGKAYLVTARGKISYVDDAEWENILAEFRVIERNNEPYHGMRWAMVTVSGHHEKHLSLEGPGPGTPSSC